MLVLSRKLGERILVPHCELVVTIVAIEGNAVRLGISAPADLAVYREELWRRMGQQKAQLDSVASKPEKAGSTKDPT
jgi:carbon storage regulator